jgi:hypothetical protein
MIFEDIAEHIELNRRGLVRGKSIFINSMPPNSEGVMLKESYAGTAVDPYIPGMRKGNFQLVARGKEYANTKSMVQEVATLLALKEQQFESIHIKICQQMTEPISFMISDGQMWEFSVKFFMVYDIVGR